MFPDKGTGMNRYVCLSSIEARSNTLQIAPARIELDGPNTKVQRLVANWEHRCAPLGGFDQLPEKIETATRHRLGGNSVQRIASTTGCERPESRIWLVSFKTNDRY